ncbi:hypothetical protein ZIOFF_028766 [Zingiber officinale]|uniref:Uncharacterized protein n=1 Tax=Zingiber officinale TaxID=94328 RepID=A0A8J5LE21_ZINOF|nr:hypothetical protein ZIOFF_028766 [Zingiber officinale]
MTKSQQENDKDLQCHGKDDTHHMVDHMPVTEWFLFVFHIIWWHEPVPWLFQTLLMGKFLEQLARDIAKALACLPARRQRLLGHLRSVLRFDLSSVVPRPTYMRRKTAACGLHLAQPTDSLAKHRLRLIGFGKMNRKQGDFSRRDSCQFCCDPRPSGERSDYASLRGGGVVVCRPLVLRAPTSAPEIGTALAAATTSPDGWKSGDWICNRNLIKNSFNCE